MTEHEIDIALGAIGVALFVFVGIPWMCLTIWDIRMESSDPVRAMKATQARQEFKANVWREFKTVVGKHLRK